MKFVLPEGVADIDFKTNFDLERKPDESRYTFLDTTGRTVVVFEGKDVSYKHAAKIAVTYNWNSILIFKVAYFELFQSDCDYLSIKKQAKRLFFQLKGQG